MDGVSYRRSFAIQLSPAPSLNGGHPKDGECYRWSQAGPLERRPFMFICKTYHLAASIARRSDPASIGYSGSIWDVVGEGGRRLKVIVTPSNCKCPGNKACRVTAVFIVALGTPSPSRSKCGGGELQGSTFEL